MTNLSELFSKEALSLLTVSGRDLVETIGLDVIRGVIFDVLTGRNIRSSTETLTRRRIASLNLATLHMFLEGSQKIDGFVEKLPHIATDTLITRSSKEEKLLANWLLGLTGKGVQNILHSQTDLIEEYRDTYIKTCQEIIQHYEKNYGKLAGFVQLDASEKVLINWTFMLYFLTTIGAQTLTIRGSEKSMYGKFFEKLVLGALLYILDFKHLPPTDLTEYEKVFWLSSRHTRNRESDATLLYQPGKGVRFDIGFIGSGNTEISLDKVSRYRREIEIGHTHWFMGTIIIVDSIGARSQIRDLAEEIDGTIIQMSGGYWPVKVARTLEKLLGYHHPLTKMEEDEQIESFIRSKLAAFPLVDFISS